MSDNSEFAKKKFWDRYISLLEQQNIKKSVQRWYVIRVEEYIKFYSDKRLQQHDKDDIHRFLKEIDRKDTIDDWQFLQIIDALYFLFCYQLQVSWCQDVDWGYWKGSAQSLTARHPTIARDQTQLKSLNTPVNSTRNSRAYESSALKQVRIQHVDIIQTLITKIRLRGYSIRTEQTYESWSCRFIAFHHNKSPTDMGVDEVTSFLEYLAVKRNVSINTQNQALNALVFLSKIF